MQDNFLEIIEQMALEKGLPKEKVENAVREGIAAAFRKDYGSVNQKVEVEIDEKTKIFRVFVFKKVVNFPEDENVEIPLILAKAISSNAKLGDFIRVEETPEAGYGRVASQVAKQVIEQKLHEAERELVALAYQDKVGEIMSGVVYEVDRKGVIITLDQGQCILKYEGQIKGERYYTGQRLRFLIEKIDLEASGSGEQIVVTRSSTDFIQKLFELEVPELSEKSVEIVKIAREPGRRTKVSVRSLQEGIDPVGTFVGQRGVRVRAVSDELGEEKLDLVLFSESLEDYIRNALSPAKVSKIEISEDKFSAKIFVPESQLALTIGRGGQNIRLAGILCGVELNVETIDESGNLSGKADLLTPLLDLEEEEREEK